MLAAFLAAAACSMSLTREPMESGFCAGDDELNNVAWVALGYEHTCAHLWIADGLAKLKCWGDNTYGQLGNGTTRDSLSPVDVREVTTEQAAQGYYISAGGHHSCFVLPDATAVCWGRNDGGQLGDGTTQHRSWPAPVQGLSGVWAIDCGMQHTCAVTMSGDVWCWGGNSDGQLGDGTRTSRTLPVQVQGVAANTGPEVYGIIAAGSRHTCVIADTSYSAAGVKCWGSNAYGQLGDGTNMDSPTAVEVPIVTPLTSPWVWFVSAGESFSCALPRSSSVKCWGRNNAGQLGDGTMGSSSSPVDAVMPIPLDLYSGLEHSCAYSDTGSYYCWGSNAYGQLGANVGSYSAEPIPVEIPQYLYYTIAGGHHTCAIYDTVDLYGGVECWGRNDSGQLGGGALTPSGPTPVRVPCR